MQRRPVRKPWACKQTDRSSCCDDTIYSTHHVDPSLFDGWKRPPVLRTPNREDWTPPSSRRPKAPDPTNLSSNLISALHPPCQEHFPTAKHLALAYQQVGRLEPVACRRPEATTSRAAGDHLLLLGILGPIPGELDRGCSQVSARSGRRKSHVGFEYRRQESRSQGCGLRAPPPNVPPRIPQRWWCMTRRPGLRCRPRPGPRIAPVTPFVIKLDFSHNRDGA